MSASKSSPGLAGFLDELAAFGNGACVGYDLCMKACPVVDPEVPISELNAAADDPASMTERVRQFAIDCVQCGRCTTACPTGAPRDHMMLHLRTHMPDRPSRYTRYDLLRGGPGTEAWHRDLLKGLFHLKARSGVDPRLRPHIDKTAYRRCDTLLYFGCYAYSHTKSPTYTLDLAEAIGDDFEVLGGLRTCCGWPQYLSGRPGRGQELLEALDGLIQQVQPEVVVSACAECVAAVQLLARRSGGAYESISTVEWLQRNRDKLDLKPGQEPIAFHDSCHLSRKMNREQHARDLARGLVDLRELEEHGQDSLCCGYYGFGLNPHRAAELRERRLDQVKATGASKVAVECVTCMESYGAAFAEQGVEVVELQMLVLDALRPREGGGR